MNIFLPIHKPLLRAYLKYLFEEIPNAPWVPLYKASSKSDFGNACISFVRYADRPINTPEPGGKFHSEHADEEWICLMMPKLDRLANAPNYHLYYTMEDIAKLNHLLQVLFNIDFDSYYLTGKKAGEKQKDIIMSFVMSRKLAGVSDVDTLKKRQYRNELNYTKKLLKQMRDLAYRRHENIQFINQQMNVNIDKIIFS